MIDLSVVRFFSSICVRETLERFDASQP